jgi:hypothetical protein
MTDNRTPAAIALNKRLARKRINELSKTTANVIFTNHARERMVEREIFADEIYRVLRTGFVDSEPELTEEGEWKCKVTLKLQTGRVAGVVTIILHKNKLLIKTVEWEDV